MAAAVGKQSIPSSRQSTTVRYPTANHHRSGGGRRAYAYTSNHNSPNTFHFHTSYGKNMGRRRPLPLQTVELKVRMCCTGCERVVKNAIYKSTSNGELFAQAIWWGPPIFLQKNPWKLPKMVGPILSDLCSRQFLPALLPEGNYCCVDPTQLPGQQGLRWKCSKLRGVDSVDVNLELEKVTVTGYVDRNKVLKEVRRCGKKAEFWPNPDLPLYFTSAKNYFHDEESFRDSYNYRRHGYNGDKHGQIPVGHRGEDPVSNMFNDDDVNACSIM